MTSNTSVLYKIHINRRFAAGGHMVQNSKILESQRMCQTPKQNTINWKSVIFLCLHFPMESCHILLLSNIMWPPAAEGLQANLCLHILPH